RASPLDRCRPEHGTAGAGIDPRAARVRRRASVWLVAQCGPHRPHGHAGHTRGPGLRGVHTHARMVLRAGVPRRPQCAGGDALDGIQGALSTPPIAALPVPDAAASDATIAARAPEATPGNVSAIAANWATERP